MIKFQTREQAQSYADKVHNYLKSLSPLYIAERWCEIGEDNTVELYADLQPDDEFEIVVNNSYTFTE
jgi:hypothetical protein